MILGLCEDCRRPAAGTYCPDCGGPPLLDRAQRGASMARAALASARRRTPATARHPERTPS